MLRVILMCLAFHSAGDLQLSANTGWIHQNMASIQAIDPSPDPNYEWFVFVRVLNNRLPQDPNSTIALPGVNVCPGTSF